MKNRIAFILLFLFASFTSPAQNIKIRLNFPVGVSVRPIGKAPFPNAIWIGPEWRWEAGRYVHVPGYWAAPKYRHGHWVSGHWRRNRRGYIWMPGKWK